MLWIIRKKRLSVTWVVLENNQICGYFSLSTASISIEHLTLDERRGYPNYPNYPAILIGKFAVDDSHRKQGVGKWMMKRIVTIVMNIGKLTGCTHLIVESKEESISYYEKELKFTPTSFSNSGHRLMSRKIEVNGEL